MREGITHSKISSFTAAFAAIWLLCTGPASAGGGMDALALQGMLNGFVNNLNVFSNVLVSPQYPTYSNTTTTAPISPATPILLEVAAWQNLMPPDAIRSQPGENDCASFGTLNGPGTGNLYCPQLAVNAVNPPAKSPPEDAAALLSGLNSLAFVGATLTTPFTVTQNLDPNATSYLYAVVEGDQGQPDTLDLFFRTGTNKKQTRGPVATISFPLAVLARGAATEKSIVATMQITATCNGAAACFTTNILADFSGTGTKKTYSLADLGLGFAFFSDPSPTYQLQIPLLVNPKTDTFYFLGPPSFKSLPQCPNGINQISGYCNAFSQTNPPNGFAPKFLSNTVIGMAPSAAPQCPGPQPGTLCPGQPNPATAPVLPTFGFCASFSKNLAAAFFLAIGPDGVTYISSLVNPSPNGASGAPYPACPS